MVNTSRYSSLNIVLIQTREALLSHFRPMLNDIGVTDQQWRIIRLLAEHGIMDFQDLAKQACILRPSLTGILTRLEKLNYVVRLKPSNDQRRVFLKLTNEGEHLYENLCKAIDARYKRLEEQFTHEKLKQLGQLLKEFTDIAIDKNEEHS